jgi:hypothetical protein
MINLKSLIVVIIYLIISTPLSVVYTQTIIENTGGMTDAVWFIDIANKIKDHEFPILPFYYSRSFLYFIINITEFPPKFYQIIIFNIINGILIYYLISKIINLLADKNAEIIKVVYFLSPGTIFLTSTFRTEWPGYLVIYLYILYVVGKVSIANGFIASFFVRASGPPTAFLVYINKNYLYKKVKLLSTLKLFIKLTIIFGLILYFINEWIFDYYSSPWYLFTVYNDELRDNLNISNNNQIYLLPFKIIISYLLDSLSFNSILDIINSPENLNNFAATIRAFIIVVILLKIIFNKFENYYLLNYYLLTTIPNIAMIGFYQTRYLIVQDIFLYIAVLNSRNK